MMIIMLPDAILLVTCCSSRAGESGDEPLFIYLFSNAYNFVYSEFRRRSKVRDDFRRRGLCNHPLGKTPCHLPLKTPVNFGH